MKTVKEILIDRREAGVPFFMKRVSSGSIPPSLMVRETA